eukprot:g869.t1
MASKDMESRDQIIAEQILEKATNFFSFNMETLIDDSTMDDYVSDGVDHFERAVSKFKGQKKHAKKIRKGSDRMMQTMRHCFDKNFDKLEIYMLRNIFHVPDDICIEYDGKMRPNPVNEDLKKVFAEKSNVVDREIMELRKEIRRAQIKKATIETECARAEESGKDAEKFRSIVEDLDATLQGKDTDKSLGQLFSKLSMDAAKLETLKNHMDTQRVVLNKRVAQQQKRRAVANDKKTPKRAKGSSRLRPIVLQNAVVAPIVVEKESAVAAPKILTPKQSEKPQLRSVVRNDVVAPTVEMGSVVVLKRTPKRPDGPQLRPIEQNTVAPVAKKGSVVVLKTASVKKSTKAGVKKNTTAKKAKRKKKNKENLRRLSTSRIVNKILERRTSFIPIHPDEMD